MRRCGSAITLTLGLALAAPAAQAQESVSGKNVAAMDGEFDPPFDCLQDVPIGTLAKGQRGAILTVHIAASDVEEGTVPRIQVPEVNGQELVGPFSIDGPAESPYGNAAVSGIWWLDLSGAEAQHPGQFVGKPLVVTISQLCRPLGDDPYQVTAVARQTKN